MSEPLIEVRGLHKSFPMGEGRIDVLRGIDLSIARGEKLAVLGSSGVGKSTLLHVLGALDHPTRGRVLFQGEDLFARDSDSLAEFRNSKLGFIFQFHHLLPEFDALENVMMPGLIGGIGFDEMCDRARKLLHEEGMFAGVSSGAIAYVAHRIADELDAGNVVFLVPDDGWKYLSSGVYTKPIEELEDIDSTVWW